MMIFHSYVKLPEGTPNHPSHCHDSVMKQPWPVPAPGPSKHWAAQPTPTCSPCWPGLTEEVQSSSLVIFSELYLYIYMCVCESIEYSLFMYVFSVYVCAIVIIYIYIYYINIIAKRPRIETRPSTERQRGQNLQGLDPEPRRRCRRGRTKNCPKWRPTACSPLQSSLKIWLTFVDLEKVWNYMNIHMHG